MKALEIERGTVFSIDGGETWLVALAEPHDGDDESIIVMVAPRNNPSLGSSSNINLGAYDHVWEPDPEALDRGADHLPIKEDFGMSQSDSRSTWRALVNFIAKRHPKKVMVSSLVSLFDDLSDFLQACATGDVSDGLERLVRSELEAFKAVNPGFMIESALIREDEGNQNVPEQESGDSLDAQVDRYLSDYETNARRADKHEAVDFRAMTRRFLIEASEDDDAGDEPETEDAPAPEPAKPSVESIDVEEFANDVARLIQNYDQLLEVHSTLIKRASNFISKNYDQAVVDAFNDSLRNKHGLVDGKTELEVDDEMFAAPPADRAGPGGAGA